MSPEYAMGSAVVATIAIYIWFVYWIAGWLANLIALPFIKSTDDDVAQYEAESIMGESRELEPVTHGDLKVRYAWYLVVFPLFIYLHYKYFDRLLVAFEWVFEQLGPLINALFYA